ncbi:phage antirepressor Ant [Clostridium perfringens]|nr:phage antirepressor Ant [Clostridium perfringens]
MNKLINVQVNEQGKQIVSAKNLYLGLGLNKSQWSRWYKANIENNDFFEENVDWAGVRHDVEGNETMDFAITLEFAKHIAMMAKTEKSHEYRNYFIECEKKVKTGQAKQIKPNLKEKEIQTRFNNSLARKANALLKIANDPLTTKERKKALLAQATEILIGTKEIKPLPQPIKKTYSATEIGKKLGISSNKVGRLANDHNLKTPEFGMFFKQTLEKNDKEVEEFKYYENVIPVLQSLLNVQVKLNI